MVKLFDLMERDALRTDYVDDEMKFICLLWDRNGERGGCLASGKIFQRTLFILDVVRYMLSLVMTC